MAIWNRALIDSDTQLNQRSYYEASVERGPAQAPLQGPVAVDAVVIGAGFAGLSAAIALADRGMRVAVLEADRICSGASGRNGGQAIVGYASGQAPLEAQLGKADARRLWDLSIDALACIDAHIARFDIDCDRVNGYLYVADAPRKAAKLQAELAALERDYGFACSMALGADVQNHIRSPRYCAAAYESVSGHLHPLKYGLGLAQAARALGVRIFEHSPVVDLQRGSQVTAVTAHGNVRAPFAVLAGNCTLGEYGPRVAPQITPRIMPVGTYVVATPPLSADLCASLIPSNAAVCDNNFVLDYFRFSADRRMLFGGRVSYTTRTPPGLEEAMRRRMARVFPQLQSVPLAFVWGGFVDISMNRAPDFGRLADNVYYLQGFSGHGVALTGLAGQMVAQAIGGQSERFDLFARLAHREFPGGSALRTPTLALAMAYHQLRDLL
jgi:gamma-glutamylputrescine oxidase